MVEEIIKTKCPSCNKVRTPERNHYKFGGNFQKLTPTGHYPICKNCLEKGFNSINPLDFKEQKKYLMMICQSINKPFISSIFEEIKTSTKSRFREFFSKISSAKYNNKGFLDGNGVRDEDGLESLRVLTDDEKAIWSSYELSLKEEIWCQEFYDATKKENKIDGSLQNSTNLANLAVIKNRIGKEVAKGDPGQIDKFQKNVRSIENDLGIIKDKAEIAGGHTSFGGLIDFMEQNDPGFEPLPQYEDVDRLLLAAKMVLGSTSVAMGKTDKKKFRDTYLKKLEVK